MKKIISFLVIFFVSVNFVSTEYKPENWSLNLIKKYNFDSKNLEKWLTRKEFLETLEKWFIDYKDSKWIKINYNEIKNFDEKYFKDINKNSKFYKILVYFTEIWAFYKKEYFYPNNILSQKDFFIVMKNLWIFDSLQNCKNLKICEKEATQKNIFNKWVYFKYVSKILNKDLRKSFSIAKDYLDIGYKPSLKADFPFPLTKQTLNWCYGFSIKNILKFQKNISINVEKTEKSIWKIPSELRTDNMKNNFDKYIKINKNNFYDIDTLINSLQTWEPVAITYKLKYFSNKEKKEKIVNHIVAAYSFDEKWVWVAETVSNTRKRIPWEEIFDKNGKTKVNRMFKFYSD